MDNNLIIDQSTFNELKELMGADFVVEIIDTFIQETEGLLDQLHSSLGGQDAVAFGRLAHSIKSSSASLGALEFSQLARELEMMGKGGDLSSAESLLGKLTDNFIFVKTRLEELKNES